MLDGKKILLIISGGIAAYKTLDLIRILRKENAHVTCVLTKGGAQFVTPLSVAALSENQVYDDLWSLTDETQMGHIRLSREHDLIIIAPGSAHMMAKMAHGLADDLASTLLLASDKPIMIAPAMNSVMWRHKATRANVDTLLERGIVSVGPNEGNLACGENGIGRMSEPNEIISAIKKFFANKPLEGLHALVTAGPTYEPLDPVRFIGNRSSGKQGYAIAHALLEAGAQVTLVSGPTRENPVDGANMVYVETALEMLAACEKILPVDICICSAAVSDWRAKKANNQKIKKTSDNEPPTLSFVENPDILKTISNHKNKRPDLVVGFAAETENIESYARSKLERKGCNWIMANLVGKNRNGKEKAFGSDENQIYFFTHADKNPEPWEHMSKKHIAHRLVAKITEHFKN
ncbi:MAG: bifunctional phosphopantothenoylcysteine decarboxylase/phosphopantothenate--cysteine ligase CoaBC [Alphaproteobacteria bacterium]|nr:bifunctional phosphopantothenoylcysteine decarboxylase/phosphopantothenate--cysteine ligase CoaBC [Alphaproteobacteria bacterium]